MFQFPEFAALGYEFTKSTWFITTGVSPFGNPRIIAC